MLRNLSLFPETNKKTKTAAASPTIKRSISLPTSPRSALESEKLMEELRVKKRNNSSTEDRFAKLERLRALKDEDFVDFDVL